jgi:filamentous hemagglutinin family protein
MIRPTTQSSIVNFTLLVGICLMPMPMAGAQVLSDGTLQTTVTSLDSRNFAIEGGSRIGPNLFHSFGQFSIPTGGAAVFNNPVDVQNLFSRVTGGTVSNINGLIEANGSANLFLLNPSGIVFGPNAQLNIGGSFLAMTANRIKFADGSEFSTTNLTPLLTISVPIALQTNSDPGSVSVNGNGHSLTTANPLLAPYFPTGGNPGLAVRPGQSITLVGGDINLTGGVLTAPSGHIDLASLGPNATINLSPTLQLGDGKSDRRNIQLTQKSLLDVNALTSGSIQIQGKDISLQDGSLIWAQNRNAQPGGDITINASKNLLLNGVAPDFSSASTIINESLGGKGGNINLTASNLSVTNGANILSRAFGFGDGGNLTILAKDFTLMGSALLLPSLFTSISTYTAASGTAGNLSVIAQNVSVLDGASLATTTVSSGNGGILNVTADTIRVSGFTPELVVSAIAAPTLGGTGSVNNITLNTRKLFLSEGGLVTASSLGAGNAGRLTINATESIVIDGFQSVSGIGYKSGIASAVAPPYEPYKTIFHLTDAPPTGSSGDLTINTPNLYLDNAGFISVENFGSGLSGNMNINADRISLKNEAAFAANSLSGQGGNIRVQSQLLTMDQGSSIFTTNYGIGDGGNISINTPILIGIHNSDIIANAIIGSGGNVQINTQGILGLKYRDRLTPDNDIAASSQFGVSGTVQVNTIGVNPSSGLVRLPVEPIDPSQKIATGCGSIQNSSFIATGRGGVADNPTQVVTVDRAWSDLRAMDGINPRSMMMAVEAAIEATTLQANSQGQMELIVERLTAPNLSMATCAKPR